MKHELNASIRDLPMPDHMKALPVLESGWPKLFFADEINGKTDLRVGDPRKFHRCVKERLCWLCGQKLGKFMAWPIGPMCVVNRVSAEPPSHRDCAEYAMIACPFMTRPHAKRRDINADVPTTVAGNMIERNPGVSALWVARDYKVFKTPDGGYLIDLGDPVDVVYYAEGRIATREEVMASIESGLPILMEQAAKDGPEGIAAFEKALARAETLIPDPA